MGCFEDHYLYPFTKTLITTSIFYHPKSENRRIGDFLSGVGEEKLGPACLFVCLFVCEFGLDYSVLLAKPLALAGPYLQVTCTPPWTTILWGIGTRGVQAARARGGNVNINYSVARAKLYGYRHPTLSISHWFRPGGIPKSENLNACFACV